MNKYWIEISNQGEIELGGLHLMGVSSKRGDESKIGFFGSGNKYAIATLLRTKTPFKIYSGTKQIKIETEKVLFKGQLYNQISIDGNKTSLTAEMGPDWETWFAVREFYCNAQDEGYASLKVSKSTMGENGKTKIYVRLTDEMDQFFKVINEYILIDKTNQLETVATKYGKVSFYSIRNDRDEIVCYRKGIRIFPKNTRKSLFKYDFDSIEINESRMYKYEHQVTERIASALAVTNNQSIIQHYLHAYKGSYEEGASWQYVEDALSNGWYELLREKRIYPESIALQTGDAECKFNSYIVPDNLAKKISEQFPDVTVIGYKSGREFTELIPTTEELNKITTAKEQLLKIGYNITSHIVLAEVRLSDVVAWYQRENNTIYLTRKHLGSLSYLKNTLLEEHFHMLGHEDGQREFVTFLIDEIIKEKETK
jgi:hypothetical protein